MNRTQSRLLGFLLALIGLGTCLGYGPWMLLRAKATESWPSVQGVITGTALDSHTDSKNRTSWSVHVDYDYQVDGAAYHGERYSIAGDPGSETLHGAEQIQAGFPTGSPVEVFFDPEDPASAVLAQGGSRKAWLTILFGFMLVIAGMVVVVRNRG